MSTLKAAVIPYVAGWVLIATASNLTYIMIGRVLTGFALGKLIDSDARENIRTDLSRIVIIFVISAMGSSPAAVYITEVARPDLRGALICLGPSMTSFG